DNPESQGQWGPWKLVGNESTNPDPGTGNDPDPGTGNDPDPGTGNDPDPGTGNDPDPGVGTYPAWNASEVYVGGDMVTYNGKVYRASWWTQGDNPESQGQWGPWKLQ
ncbi:MAG: hypothetical protein J6U37_03885, partial [Lachnospiraceae bacterium]|nr:hypothetical protein [Lachnospiraceae bacterium]